MTREDVIRMAREAGITFVTEYGVASATPEWLERFATLVLMNTAPRSFMSWQEGYAAGVIAEREECAKVCEEHWRNCGNAMECADAIRARGAK
jgi:hypothetical protein